MTGKKTGKKRSSGDLLVAEVVASHSQRQLPVTEADTAIEKLIEAIEWFRHSRRLYVVDHEGRLIGNITLGRLVRHSVLVGLDARLHLAIDEQAEQLQRGVTDDADVDLAVVGQALAIDDIDVCAFPPLGQLDVGVDGLDEGAQLGVVAGR